MYTYVYIRMHVYVRYVCVAVLAKKVQGLRPDSPHSCLGNEGYHYMCLREIAVPTFGWKIAEKLAQCMLRETN